MEIRLRNLPVSLDQVGMLMVVLARVRVRLLLLGLFVGVMAQLKLGLRFNLVE